MPEFKYWGKTDEGVSVKGKVEAQTTEALRALLAGRGITADRLKVTSSLLQFEVRKTSVKRHETMHLSRQLAAFVRAGVPILDGIEVIAQESANRTLQTALYDIAESLRSGERLSEAFGKHRKIFPRLYINLVKAAELTGELDKVLEQLGDYLERDIDSRQKIRSALTYPSILIVMGIITVTVLTVFVIPRFTSFFESVNADLPLATRTLIRLTDFLGEWWWLVISLGILLLLTGLVAVRTGARAFVDRALLRLPIFGEVLRFAIIERFCRTLSAMVSAGVSLPEAMVVVGDVTDNAVFSRGIRKVREQMLQGEGLAGPMASVGLFPSTVIQMVRVGEDTGSLDVQLRTAATFYERELTYKIKKMATLFEPIVVVSLAVVVGFVAIAVISAMFSVYDQIGSI